MSTWTIVLPGGEKGWEALPQVIGVTCCLRRTEPLQGCARRAYYHSAWVPHWDVSGLNSLKLLLLHKTITGRWVWSGLELHSAADWTSRERFEEPRSNVHSKKRWVVFSTQMLGWDRWVRALGCFNPILGWKLVLIITQQRWVGNADVKESTHVTSTSEGTSARSRHFLSLKEAISEWKTLW